MTDKSTESEPSPVDAAMRRYQEAVAAAEQAAAAPGTDIVPAAGTDQAMAMKTRLVEQRAAVLRAQQDAASAQKELQTAIDEQKRALEQAMRRMQAELEPIMKKARLLGDGISAINIYLGRDEEIEVLREGERAPADVPVSVRQLVLAMDEESLIAADGDGMDYKDVGEFCDWLLRSPAHLDQVLPEQKGVVALIPRRHAKDYGNPWESTVKNEANQHTYWLVRNGECLWLTTTEFVVGKFTVPRPSDFTGLFEVRDRWTGKVTHLEPGTDAWAKAEETADARTRHYMKVALLLEGLVDRTTVFHPHNGASFLSQADYDADRIRIILDAENSLTTGRVPYREWQRKKMGQLTEGMRVVGAFAQRMRLWSGKDHRADVRPENAAPKNHEAYVVKATDRMYYDFQFSFDRADEIFDKATWSYRPAKTKGTGYLHVDDEWVIPIDLVTVDEMRGYLNARTERHNYLALVPTLRAAIAFKEAETAAEAPFLAALVGRLQHAGIDDAEAKASDLIAWYKTANKWHRPLDADDAKAARAILAEARRRDAGTDDATVTALREQYPNAMVIARRTDDMIVVEPQPREFEHAEQNVFVTVHVHGLRGGHKESKTWQTLRRSQTAKWTILHRAEAFNGWMLDPKKSTYLTDDELAYAVRRAHELYEGVMLVRYGQYDQYEYRTGPRLVVYIADGSGRGDHDDLRLAWPARDDLQVGPNGQPRSGDIRWDEPYWETNWSGALKPGTSEVFIDEKLVTAERAVWEQKMLAQKADQAAHQEVQSLKRQIERAWEAAAVERLHERFLEDFGDEALWEGHLKTIKVPRYPHRDEAGSTRWNEPASPLHTLVETIVSRGGSVAGMSVTEAAEAAGVDPDLLAEDVRDLHWPDEQEDGTTMQTAGKEGRDA